MLFTPVKTPVITSNSTALTTLLKQTLPQPKERSVIAVTSKIVSLCEGRTIPMTADKEALIQQESSQYTEPLGKHGFHFSITNNTLIPAAGIDESNGGDVFILWPKDAQKTAQELWQFLRSEYGLQEVGVIITDSTCMPLRRGTTGIVLAHCGFEALRNYVGQPDLFGRPFRVSQANIASGLAAGAVLAMGEGTEQTPLCIVENAPNLVFQNRIPTSDELQHIPIEEDIFAPMIQAVPWKTGRNNADAR